MASKFNKTICLGKKSTPLKITKWVNVNCSTFFSFRNKYEHVPEKPTFLYLPTESMTQSYLPNLTGGNKCTNNWAIHISRAENSKWEAIAFCLQLDYRVFKNMKFLAIYSFPLSHWPFKAELKIEVSVSISVSWRSKIKVFRITQKAFQTLEVHSPTSLDLILKCPGPLRFSSSIRFTIHLVSFHSIISPQAANRAANVCVICFL